MGSFDQSLPRRCGADDASLPSESELLLCKGGQLEAGMVAFAEMTKADSSARVPDRIPPPREPINIEPERIFADQPRHDRGAEHNRDGSHEALSLDGRAGFKDPFLPANLENIFGYSLNLGHGDRDGAASDFREGTFIASIRIERSRSLGG